MEHVVPLNMIQQEEGRHHHRNMKATTAQNRFDIALDELHENAKVSAASFQRLGTGLENPLRVVEAIREYRNVAMERVATASVENSKVARYHTNIKASSAEEMRQVLLDDYIEKLMAHIHFSFVERSTSLIIPLRDVDMVPRISSIMISLGYQFHYTKETLTINVAW